MNDYFDKIYCINLDKRTDRWEEVKNQFEKHNLQVERFSAIEGNPTGIETKIVPGHAGCVLSHLKVIKDAKEKNYKKILVLEDDVEFIDDLQERFKIYINQVPDDWDMIYFGGNHNGIPLEMVSDNVGRTKKTYTTHAYAIKGEDLFDVVIKTFSKLQKEVDVYYSMIQQGFKCYVFRPHLAWQKEGFSDILNRDVNYDFLKK